MNKTASDKTQPKLIDLFNVTIADFLCPNPVTKFFYDLQNGIKVQVTLTISPRLNNEIKAYAGKNGIGQAEVMKRLISEANCDKL